MFDLNGDGDVDVEEFEKVTALIRQRTSVGARHRELSASANSLRVSVRTFKTYEQEYSGIFPYEFFQ